MSEWLRKLTGRWWICGLLFVASLVMFSWIVPSAVSTVTDGRTLAPMILDERFPTWSADIADTTLQGLGPEGRQAYQTYYLQLDFWFPVLTLSLFYVSLLSLAFRSGSRFSWLNLTPIALYALDVAENINHFTMAGSYPNLASVSLAVGPALTLGKWIVMILLFVIGVIGLLFQIRLRPRRNS